MEQMNEKLARLYDYIVERIGAGRSPSLREICIDLGIKSTSTVHKYLGELEAMGYIERDPNLNRSICLPAGHGGGAVQVPLLGTVAAGSPILAVEQIEDYVSYTTTAHSARDLFALRVKGDSMIEIGIFEGDIIIAKKTPVARNGEIIVALVEDEATVKRFFKENGYFRLQPENSSMEPIIVNEVIVLGKVVALIRNFE